MSLATEHLMTSRIRLPTSLQNMNGSNSRKNGLGSRIIPAHATVRTCASRRLIHVVQRHVGPQRHRHLPRAGKRRRHGLTRRHRHPLREHAALRILAEMTTAPRPKLAVAGNTMSGINLIDDGITGDRLYRSHLIGWDNAHNVNLRACYSTLFFLFEDICIFLHWRALGWTRYASDSRAR